MNVKDLLFYNKEGYPMNLQYDATLDLWSGKVLFDRNSIDTYKSQSIYTFEKIASTNYTFNVSLDTTQIYNTDDFNIYPRFDLTIPFEIINITKTNVSSSYYTKWIWATDIQKYVYVGQYVYLTGLTGDYEELTAGEINAFQILDVQKNKILIQTLTDNSVALPVFVLNTSTTIVPINVIEVIQSAALPSWTESSINATLYQDKMFTLVGNTDNAGVYTIVNPSVINNKSLYEFPSNTIPFGSPGQIKIDLEILTDRIKVHKSTIDFDNGASSVTLNVTAFTQGLSVGSVINFYSDTSALNASNLVDFTIVSIDRPNATIVVSPAPFTETVLNCDIYLVGNIFTILQDMVLDNSNQTTLPLTYSTIVDNYAEDLARIGIKIEYDLNNDALWMQSTTRYDIFTPTVNWIDPNAVVTLIPPSINTLTVTPIVVEEELVEIENIPSDATKYERVIQFLNIDTTGLDISINGISYTADFDTDINNTIGDWITAHAAILLSKGIVVTQSTIAIPGDTIAITSEWPNVPVFVEMNMSGLNEWVVLYRIYSIANILTQLGVTINGTEYAVVFDTDDATTVTNWVAAYAPLLLTKGIIAVNALSDLGLHLIDPEQTLEVTFNIGYTPKNGDLSIFQDNLSKNNSGTLLVSNEIQAASAVYDFANKYAVGQKISISGADKLPQNKQYNILSLTPDIISLSYQGSFWDQTPDFDVNIVSDRYLSYPRSGELGSYSSTLRWTWKDTQVDDFFLYDFSGYQLTPHQTGFPNYSGPLPLCGDDGSITLKLNKEPNKDINLISDPTKQQTIFDLLTFDIPNNDDNIEILAPLQCNVGYRAAYESWNKARLYLDLIESVSYSLETNSNLTDDLWVFTSNYVEIQNVTVPFDFLQLNFKPGQLIKFESTDVNADGRQRVKLKNSGILYKIAEVYTHKIVFTEDVIAETTVVEIATTTQPYYDPSGNPYTEFRRMGITMSVQPRVIAYLDMYGESEDEDERHKININNRSLNVLKLQDIYIFKDADIYEQGIDWILLNRKRKELIEIWPEIFNNLPTYKAIMRSINFWGYNDLTFTEYYQMLNVDSKKFGELFNVDLLNIFNKSIPGYTWSNSAITDLKVKGWRKTGLFSLNYNITDGDGNFISAYSEDEVKIKLLGLKKWLSENVVPIGSKLININGKYKVPSPFTIKHETYMTQNYRVEEYSTPIEVVVSGNLSPITTGSNMYNISLAFECVGDIEWFEFKVRTFFLPAYNENNVYLIGDKVYYSGKIWEAFENIPVQTAPGSTGAAWIESTIDDIGSVQVFKDYRYDNTGFAFTIDKTVDPHFIVEVNYHSGYACTWLNKKTYSVLPEFYDAFV